MPRKLRVEYAGAMYHVIRLNQWETAEAKAERILAKELGRLGWKEAARARWISL
jgi:hypothetical protein